MEKMLIHIKEAAEIKASILKQEAALWQKIAQAFEAYVAHSEKNAISAAYSCRTGPIP